MIWRLLFRIMKVVDAQSPLTCIDIMPDGATAAVGSTRGKVYIYDLRQGGTPVHIFQAHKTSVRSVKFMPTATLKVRCLSCCCVKEQSGFPQSLAGAY